MVSPWRPSLKVQELAPLLVEAAVQLQIPGVTDPVEFQDPGDRDGRIKRANLATQIIEQSLEAVAKGAGGAIELDTRKEPFFERARTKPKEHELVSQKEAIAKFLGLEADGEILLSESELVSATIRAAKELGQGDGYNLETLIRDGIRRVGQELISNAVNKTNRDANSAPSPTSPGSRWDAYETAYLYLKSILGTKTWGEMGFRKPFITCSYIAGAVNGSKTNVVQIRRWVAGTGKQIIPAPLPDEDQTAGGLIVDDKMEREGV